MAGKPVFLHDEAKAKLQDSIDFYRERGSESLAIQFKQEVAYGFEALRRNPERWSPMLELDGIRKYRLLNFPFSNLYIVQPKKVWVVAVAHGSRRPGFWTGRI